MGSRTILRFVVFGLALPCLLGETCSLMVMLPFTKSRVEPYDPFAPSFASRRSYSYLAASILAMDHFNQRNKTVVPELGSMFANCSFYFDTPTVVDTEAHGKVATQKLWRGTIGSTNELPCAILGPLSRSAMKHVVAATNAFEIPMLNYFREDIPLAGEPSVVGLGLSAVGRARAILDYFSSDEYLAVWSSTSSESSFLNVLLNEKGSMEIRSVSSKEFQDQAAALQYLFDTGVRTIYFDILDPLSAKKLAETMERHHMLDKGKIFILPPEVIPLDSLDLLYGDMTPGSPLDKFFSGALVFDRLDSFRDTENDPFLESWRSQNIGAVAWMNKLRPETAHFDARPGYFQHGEVPYYASYAYDAVMAIGMGGCALEEAETSKAQSDAIDSEATESKNDDSTEEKTTAPFLVPDGLVAINVDSYECREAENECSSDDDERAELTERYNPFKTLVGNEVSAVSVAVGDLLANATLESNPNGTSGELISDVTEQESRFENDGNVFDVALQSNLTSQGTLWTNETASSGQSDSLSSESPVNETGSWGVDSFELISMNGTSVSPGSGDFDESHMLEEIPELDASHGKKKTAAKSEKPALGDGNTRERHLTGNPPHATGFRMIQDGNEKDAVLTLLQGIRMSDFTGASGRIEFGKESGNERNSKDIAIGLYNVLPSQIDPATKKRTHRTKLVAKFTQQGGWVDEPGTSIFHRDPSKESIMSSNKNFLSPIVRAVGLTLMAIAWIVSITGFALVHVLRKDAAVQRAQPFFMQVLCWGAFVMSSTIFLLSWDEGAGWSHGSLCNCCTLAPWFFFGGQTLILCALFTKLWRVDEVLQFRRRTVSVGNVMKPTLGLMFVALSILISWTIIDPWKWHREPISVVPPESYGFCDSPTFWYFFGPLVALLLLAESLTLYFAWKTCDIPEDFRDSGAVFYASFAQLQAWSIGVPMLAVLGTSSADATYFGRVVLIWIFAVSSVVVVVGPKVWKAIAMRIYPATTDKSRVRISGVQHTSGVFLASPPSSQEIVDSHDGRGSTRSLSPMREPPRTSRSTNST